MTQKQKDIILTDAKEALNILERMKHGVVFDNDFPIDEDFKDIKILKELVDEMYNILNNKP